MSEKIDKTLKKIAAGISKANSQTSSSTDGSADSQASHYPGAPAPRYSGLPGDPNCPLCGGIGYLRLDVPVDHPSFGKLEVCTCRTRDAGQQARDRLYALSNLSELSHLTFDNFQPRGRVGLGAAQADSLERAFNQASQFSQTLNGWLIIQGKVGCGKTHLAAAIANFAVSLGVPTLFITVPDLLDLLRFSYDDPESTFEERFEEIRSVRLLVMDDFGTQNATPWAQEKLFQIINHRYTNRLPLVLTTNLALDEINERIRSRLQDPQLVTRATILAPDYRRPLEETGHSELSSLGLLHTRTFANFDLRKNEKLAMDELKGLEKAFRAARGYAEDPQGWLVFIGVPGCGKTHLAAAIANYRSDLGQPPLFISVPDFLDHLRATFSPASQVSFDRRFLEVRSAQLLVLDDLGTESATPWAREKLYQLLNYRYNAELPTIITTTTQLEDLDARLKSRLMDKRLCQIFAILAPCYSGGQPRQPARPSSGRNRTRK